MRKSGVVLASAVLAVGALFLGSYMGPAGPMRKAKAQTVSYLHQLLRWQATS